MFFENKEVTVGTILYKGRHLPDLASATRENIFDFLCLAKQTKHLFTNRLNNRDSLWHFNTAMKTFEEKFPVFELFFQPSTRTYFTTKVAVQLLGGAVDGVTNPSFSSLAKGESLKATVRTLARIGYKLIIVRYAGKEHDVVQRLADMCENENLDVSMVSAGESGGKVSKHHPLQALCDMFTVYEAKKESFLDGILTYAVVGDLSGSRTIHDFLDAVSRFGARKVYGVGGMFNNLPERVLTFLHERGIKYQKTSDLLSVAREVNVWYFTRYQQEYKWFGWLLKRLYLLRFLECVWYARWYGVSDELRAVAKQDAIFLHPLPHGFEYPEDIHTYDKRFLHYDPMILNSVITKMTLFKLIFRPSP